MEDYDFTVGPDPDRELEVPGTGGNDAVGLTGLEVAIEPPGPVGQFGHQCCREELLLMGVAAQYQRRILGDPILNAERIVVDHQKRLAAGLFSHQVAGWDCPEYHPVRRS